MTADANRAEALTCKFTSFLTSNIKFPGLDRAREALRMGDHAKAKRMLQKAKNLDPKQDVSCKFLLSLADQNSFSFVEKG